MESHVKPWKLGKFALHPVSLCSKELAEMGRQLGAQHLCSTKLQALG